ncbi:MAG TPA: RsmF rRNA methyltransferase first C-terminal domain-containing protein [Chitinophagaceae bacterium]|nr:RsmF rRNA methyltransferase first C-terminal domain-containing protein [Chitinophagaceae bacterium]
MQTALPAALLTSLENIQDFNKILFEQVHASGVQVTSVRLNPAKKIQLQQSNLAYKSAVPWCLHGMYLQQRPSFTYDPFFHAGCYYVQEAGSMFLWHVLQQLFANKERQLKVLDLCAAPGGKSTLLASFFTEGLIVANEVIQTRAAVLAENTIKWGAANIVVTNNDPSAFARLENFFDLLVIDAPCSGSGLFRKQPEAIEEWSEENVKLCSQRQQRILSDVYTSLKADGIIIYSTCSYSKEENENILDWLMENFSVENIRLPVNDEWGITETMSDKHGCYGYRFYPYKTESEGFFIAAFRKKDGDENCRVMKSSLVKLSKADNLLIEDWVKHSAEEFFFRHNDDVYAVPALFAADINRIIHALKIKKTGVHTGTVKGKDFIPSHELAMSMLLNENISSVQLDKENTLLFLKKLDFQLPPNISNGWQAVRFENIWLGWIKVIGSRVNNYYPAAWRILK